MAAEVELQRRLPDDSLAPWRLNADGTDPVADAEARTRLQEAVTHLQAIVDRLSAALAVGGTVALDPATLAALESIQVSNLPDSYPLPVTQVDQLRSVTVENMPAPATAVAVNNLPESYPLPQSQVNALRDITVQASVESAGLAQDATLQEVATNTEAIEVGVAALEEGIADQAGWFYRLLNQMIPDGWIMRSALQEDADPDSIYLGASPEDATPDAVASFVLRILLVDGSPSLWKVRGPVAWSEVVTGSGW